MFINAATDMAESAMHIVGFHVPVELMQFHSQTRQIADLMILKAMSGQVREDR